MDVHLYSVFRLFLIRCTQRWGEMLMMKNRPLQLDDMAGDGSFVFDFGRAIAPSVIAGFPCDRRTEEGWSNVHDFVKDPYSKFHIVQLETLNSIHLKPAIGFTEVNIPGKQNILPTASVTSSCSSTNKTIWRCSCCMNCLSKKNNGWLPERTTMNSCLSS